MDIFNAVWLSVMVVMSAFGAASMFHYCNASAEHTTQQARTVRGMSMMVGLIWVLVGLVLVARLMVKGCV